MSPPIPANRPSPGRIHSHHGYGGGGGGVGAAKVPSSKPIATVRFSSGPRSVSDAVNVTAEVGGAGMPRPASQAVTCGGHSALPAGPLSSHRSVEPSGPE